MIITLIVMNAILLISGMKHHYLAHYHMAVIMELFIIRHLDNAQIAKMQFEIVILALIVLIVQNAMDYISQRLMEGYLLFILNLSLISCQCIAGTY